MNSIKLYQRPYSKKKVVHFSGCRYLKGTPEPPKEIEYEPTVLFFKTHSFCQMCSPVSVQYRNDKDRIEHYAAVHRQTLSLKLGVLEISTKQSNWLIVPGHENKGVCLYHKNTIQNIHNLCAMDGYHRQKTRRKTIFSCLIYINDHDKFTLAEEKRKQEAIRQENELKEAERKAAEESARTKKAASELAKDFIKFKKRKNPSAKPHTGRKSNVITADTSDWETFMALFKPNAAK